MKKYFAGNNYLPIPQSPLINLICSIIDQANNNPQSNRRIKQMILYDGKKSGIQMNE
ncbi:MAG TPA: hypothetical protein VJ111_06160 [Chitinophagaceae bacterium]|nr:hypothetical protein [Chitinophagaceae bacterium]